jgi:hypothetical protein
VTVARGVAEVLSHACEGSPDKAAPVQSEPTVRSAALRSSVLSSAKAILIGLRPGE